LPPGRGAEAALSGETSINSADGPLRARVYDRARFGMGDVVSGPAVLTQLDATTLLLPGQVATVHERGALIVKEVP
jgi:N-methylhydantoinase A